MRIGCCFFLLGASVNCRAEKPSICCEPTPEIREELRQLSAKTRKVTGVNRFEVRKTLTAEVLARHPDNYFVNRRYIESVRFGKLEERKALIERYKTLAERHPGSAPFATLYAQTLLGIDTPRAISVLKGAEGAGADPWVTSRWLIYLLVR